MSPAPDAEILVAVERVATIGVRVDPPTVHAVAVGTVGPPGPVGPAGGTVVDSWWSYAVALTPPPLTGEIRTTPDPVVLGQPMTIYLSSRDKDGLYWDSSILLPGDDLVMRGTGGNLWRCTVTSVVATVPGVDGYATIAAIPIQVTGQVGKNKDIEVTFVRPPEPGPQGEPGVDGVDGAPGAPGTPGEKWYTQSSGAPPTGTGIVGDFMLSTLTGDFYEKTGVATWTLRGNLKGVAGEKWFTGAGVPVGATGAVNDWYIDSANGDYYEKTGASLWTVRGNLKGPAGSGGAPMLALSGLHLPVFRYGHMSTQVVTASSTRIARSDPIPNTIVGGKVEVTTFVASSVVYVVVYADGPQGLPGALLYQSAAIDTSTTGFKTFTIGPVPPGTYWWGVANISASNQPALRSSIGANPNLPGIAIDIVNTINNSWQYQTIGSIQNPLIEPPTYYSGVAHTIWLQAQ